MVPAVDLAGVGEHTGLAMACLAQLTLATACGDGRLHVMYPDDFAAVAQAAERSAREHLSERNPDPHLDSHLLWRDLAGRVAAELERASA